MVLSCTVYEIRRLIVLKIAYFCYPSQRWRFGLVVASLGTSTKLLYADRVNAEMVTVRGYTVLVFNQATQANSAWSSLRG